MNDKQKIIDMMKSDEELGLYEYIGECKGNNNNGCFMDSSGQDCGCYTRVVKQEIKLEDVFNDEKRQGVKDLIDAQKQYFYCSDRLELDENERCITQCEHCAVIQPKYTIGCDPYDKQETLEEASWKFNPLKKLDGEFLRAAFIAGAKWQAERMYSEEEVLELIQKALTHQDDGEIGNLVTAQKEIRTANFYSWFNKFKNK
jgi:hypothetical protein